MTQYLDHRIFKSQTLFFVIFHDLTFKLYKAKFCCVPYYRIDDIEDSSILRRGIPVAHHIFGVPSTINAANYIYFVGLEKTLTLGHADATKVFTGKHLLFKFRFSLIFET